MKSETIRTQSVKIRIKYIGLLFQFRHVSRIDGFNGQRARMPGVLGLLNTPLEKHHIVSATPQIGSCFRNQNAWFWETSFQRRRRSL